MRIYTEVNFQWNDKKGKLVEVSSDSFDYSGEMALCGKGDWHTKVYYDAAGNEWKVRGLEGWFNEIGRIHYFKNGVEELKDSTPPGDNAWSNQKVEFRDWVYDRGDFVAPAAGRKLFGDEAELDAYWEDNYFETRPDSVDTAEESIKERFHSKDYTYAAGEWREIATELEGEAGWTESDAVGAVAGSGGVWTYTPPEEQTQAIQDLIDSGGYDEIYDLNKDDVIDALDLEVLGTPGATPTLSKDAAIAGAQATIEDYITNWEKIVDPDIEDAAQILVEGYGTALKNKETAVRTAYEDIFGEEGTIFDIQKTWETEEERAEKQYTKGIGLAVTEREEGLETTVTGREGELEALREEAGTNIRAAEAKIGAAGFASTGVGQTARDVLAKEIGGVARDIDEGFTEERSDVKRQYLETVDPLKEKFKPGEGTAYEDYITTRDQAAKGALKPWETASRAYEQAKTAYEETQIPLEKIGYTESLEDIGLLISETIQGITEPLSPGEDPLSADWDPFTTSYFPGYSSVEQFGIDPATMTFTSIPTTGEYAVPTDFYTPYRAEEDLKLYDPEKLLPWETPTAPGGDPYKPGGQT